MRRLVRGTNRRLWTVWDSWWWKLELLSESRLPLCLRSSPRFCWAPWIKTSSSSRCGPGSKSPCTRRTSQQVSKRRVCVHSHTGELLYVSGAGHNAVTVSGQSAIWYSFFLLPQLTNDPNSVSDWLPPCSYTETFREWASLQVCVPLPFGDAATVLMGLIR